MIRVLLALIIAGLYFTGRISGTLAIVLLVVAGVFLLTSFQDIGTHRAATQAAMKKLGLGYRLGGELKRPQIHIWIFEKQAKRAKKGAR